MTIFAGIIELTTNELSLNARTALKAIMEEDIQQKCSFEYTHDNVYCINFDSGAYQAPAIQQCNEGFTLVVGDPIISQGISRSRTIDVMDLHSEFKHGVPKSLAKARGVFSGIHFNYASNKCYLFTDKLGLRPVYYYQKSGLFIFSSVFSYFEKIPFIDLEEDFIGICETASFTYPLGIKTTYKNIKLFRAGEMLTVENEQVLSDIYWDWTSIAAAQDKAESDLHQQAFDTFDDAIRLRLGDEKNVFAFLSGGLDSRCVTAGLKSHVDTIHTFNFSKEQSQDSEFASLYSQHLQSNHHEIRVKKLYYPNWSQLISEQLANIDLINADLPKYPQKVWSGDGGSVGAGFVYLDDEIINQLEVGLVDKAIENFLKKNKTGIPFAFISKSECNNPRTIIHESVISEIAGMDRVPTEKKLYLFLLLNDQRRHLVTHFETIAQHRIELMLPFFDSDFLATMLSIPIKKALNHRFYMGWFNLFPEFVRMCPWQTYPGHLKCPLEIPANLSLQWESGQNTNIHKNNDDANFVIHLILNNPSVRRYISTPLVLFAMYLHKLNLRPYPHLVKFMKTLSKYIKNS